MAVALVTGSGQRVDEVAKRFADEGLEVRTAANAAALAGLDLSAGVERYVQLPSSIQPVGDTVVGRVRAFLSEGLIGRFALVETVLPALTADATIVLVSGNTPTEGAEVPDDQRSRLAFLDVLAHAARAEVGARGGWVTVVAGTRGDADLVDFALRRSAPSTTGPESGERMSRKQYEDWRTEVMGLVDFAS